MIQQSGARLIYSELCPFIFRHATHQQMIKLYTGNRVNCTVHALYYQWPVRCTVLTCTELPKYVRRPRASEGSTHSDAR